MVFLDLRAQRTLAVVFCVMSALVAPALLIASRGNRIQADDLDLFKFSRLSLGNIGNVTNAEDCKCACVVCYHTDAGDIVS